MADILEKRNARLEEIHPSEHNPRRILETRMNALRRSLREHPEHLEARPIVVRTTGEIIAGEMRWRAAGLENFETVPVVVVEIDDDEAREWLLRDNQEYGEWVEQQLAEMLYDLEQKGRDLELTGFSREEATKLLDTVAGKDKRHNWPDDPAPRPPKNPTSRTGRVYKLGVHRLMCGDATNPKHVAKLLDGAEPKLLVTDPPYGIDLDLTIRDDPRRGKSDGNLGYTRSDAHQTTSLMGDMRVDWSEAFDIVPSLQIAYVWHDGNFADEVLAGLKRIGFVPAQQIIWDKMAFALSRSHYHWQHESAFYAVKVGAEVPWYGPIHDVAVYARKPGHGMPWLGSRDQHTVWQAPSPKMNRGSDEEAVDHPTQKPALLYTRPITNHLLRGEAVYDPFGGSGTAVIAAEMTGRVAYTMELDPAFCDVIRERFKRYTGSGE